MIAATAVTAGEEQPFTATGYDQFGDALTTPPTFAWSVAPDGAGGSIDASSGLYTAPTSGGSGATDTILAGSGTDPGIVTGSAAVTVIAPVSVMTLAAPADPAAREGSPSVAIAAAGRGGLRVPVTVFAPAATGRPEFCKLSGVSSVYPRGQRLSGPGGR
jgi:hypothetical protein